METLASLALQVLLDWLVQQVIQDLLGLVELLDLKDPKEILANLDQQVLEAPLDLLDNQVHLVLQVPSVSQELLEIEVILEQEVQQELQVTLEALVQMVSLV